MEQAGSIINSRKTICTGQRIRGKSANSTGISDNPAIGIRAKPEKTVYIDHNIFNYNSDSGYPTPVFLRACDINGAMTMTRNYVGYDGETPKFVAGDIVSYNISKPNSCG
jgi:hypothetical protein